MPLRSVGFPCARHEAAEVREFLPAFFAFLQQFRLERVVVENGYGARLPVPSKEYDAAYPGLEHGSRDDAFKQDLVVLLRCPSEPDLRRLRRGGVLLSMLHFPTRPARARLMEELGVTGVAMDQITDDLQRRLVENLEAVGFNGVRVGMEALAERWPAFADPRRGPLRVTVLGAGAVGAHAMRAAVRYGDEQVRERLRSAGVPGVLVTALDVELTQDALFLESTLRRTDLLVDATLRREPTTAVVKNAQLTQLPLHAVIVDLSVDPYDLERSPPVVKAVEGIPQGDLDHYVFPVTDPAWAALDPRIPNQVRRTVASCYSWPGIRPLECMQVYGKQLEPVVRALINRGTAAPGADFTMAERATARGFHHHWLPGGAR
jgi:alanine dehydrogenase